MYYQKKIGLAHCYTLANASKYQKTKKNEFRLGQIIDHNGRGQFSKSLAELKPLKKERGKVNHGEKTFLMGR